MVASNKHEVVDARVWNPFYGQWWPLQPFTRLEYEHTADWAINTATATVPADHPSASIFAKVEEGIPAPVTITLNGVVWTGQVTTAYSFNEKGKSGWKLTLSSDDKHLHRMLARPPAQSAADDTETRLAGYLGQITEQLVSVAASRTGLPTYVVIEADGDPVELQARTESSVADVLADATAGSNLLAEARMILPGDTFPAGTSMINLYQGDMERRWANQQLANGVWPHATNHPRVFDRRALTYPIVPPYSWNGAGTIGITGQPLDPTIKGIAWRPFQVKPVQDGSYFGAHDADRARVMTDTELVNHHQTYGVLPWHVTVWEPGTFSQMRDQQHLVAAAEAGLLRRADGVQITADTVAADVYVWVGQQAAYAWLDEAGWVIGLQQHIDAEIASRTPNGASQRQIPGLMVRLYPERDRRGIVFSSAPGGGLSSWGITHNAPEGAMLISGVQMDALLLEYLQSGEASEQAVFGQRGLMSVDEINAVAGEVSAPVDGLAIDVDPQRTLAGTDVSFHKAGAKVNIAQAGLFFYREQYSNLSTGNANPVTEMVKKWKEAQGGTSATMTVGATENVVFGDDVHLPDGRVLDGWRPGDRVSFVDKDTRVSELIVGYKVVAEADKPISVTPTIGRRDNGVMAQLGDRLRGAETTAKQATLAAQRRITESEFEVKTAEVAEPVVEALVADQVGDIGETASTALAIAEAAALAAQDANGVIQALVVEGLAAANEAKQWAGEAKNESTNAATQAALALAAAEESDILNEDIKAAKLLIDQAVLDGQAEVTKAQNHATDASAALAAAQGIQIDVEADAGEVQAKLTQVVNLHGQVLTAHGEAISSATTAAQSALDAAAEVAAAQAIQIDINATLAKGVRAAGHAAAYATTAIMMNSQAIEQVAIATQKALDAASENASALAAATTAGAEAAKANDEALLALQAKNDAQKAAQKANTDAISALQRHTTRVMFLPDSTKGSTRNNPQWAVTFSGGKRVLTAKPGWVGEWIYHCAVHRSGDFGPVIEGGEVSAANRTFTLDTATSSATLMYTIRPGVPRIATPPSVVSWVPDRDTWVNMPVNDTADGFSAGVFTAKTAGEHEIYFRVGWDATTRNDSYGVKLTRQKSGGSVQGVREIKQVGIGPLFSGQDGYRTQSIQVTLNLSVNERVFFQAWAGAGGTNQRRMRDSEITVGWVDSPPDNSDIV